MRHSTGKKEIQREEMKALTAAEHIDSYRKKCSENDLNTRARARCTYIPWTDPNSFSSYALEGETIVTMHPSADGGMPHTRPPSTICLPAYFPESRLVETLSHERIHLDQRKRCRGWIAALGVEGWTSIEEEEIPEEYRKRCRINPDTCWSPFWAWNGRYVPLPFFVREDKPELNDIAVRWYDLQEEIVGSVVPFSLVQKYGKLKSHSLEHPFELMAYSMEKQ
jgi:hypothetical protein